MFRFLDSLQLSIQPCLVVSHAGKKFYLSYQEFNENRWIVFLLIANSRMLNFSNK